MSTASESSSEVELVDEVKTQAVELFWFLENGKVKSTKDVPATFKNSDGSGPKEHG